MIPDDEATIRARLTELKEWAEGERQAAYHRLIYPGSNQPLHEAVRDAFERVVRKVDVLVAALTPAPSPLPHDHCPHYKTTIFGCCCCGAVEPAPPEDPAEVVRASRNAPSVPNGGELGTFSTAAPPVAAETPTRRACACRAPDPVQQADGKFYCYRCSFETGARPRAGQTASPPPGWQPMSSAPRDGTLILLHPSRGWSADVNCDCEVGYWDKFTGEWEAFGPTAKDYTGPKLWHPLPALPAVLPADAPAEKET